MLQNIKFCSVLYSSCHPYILLASSFIFLLISYQICRKHFQNLFSTGLTIRELLKEKTSSKIEHQSDTSHKEITAKVIRKKNSYSEGVIDEIDHQNMSYRQITDKIGKKIDYGNHRINGGGDKKFLNNKSDLIAIMKVFL